MLKFHRGSGTRIMAGILIVCALLLIHASPYAAHSGHTVFLPWVSTPPIPLPNGDFESQPVIWSFLPEDAPLIFAQNELPEGTVPRSGTRVAWLGDQGDQSQSHRTEISQTVTLPGNDPVLRFWVWMQSGEPCDMTRDQLRVYSNGELEFSLDICKEKSTNSWAEQIVELSGMQDDTVTLRIQVETVNSNPYSPASEVFLDDFIFATH